MKKFRIILGVLSTFVFGIFGTNAALALWVDILVRSSDGASPMADSFDLEWCDMSDIGEGNCTRYRIENLNMAGQYFTEDNIKDFCNNYNYNNTEETIFVCDESIDTPVCAANAKTVNLHPCESSSCDSKAGIPACDIATGCYDSLYYWNNTTDTSLSGWYTGETCTSGNKISQLNPENLPKRDGYTFLGYFHSGSHLRDAYTLNNTTIEKDIIEILPDGTFNTGNNSKTDEMNSPESAVTLYAQWAKNCASDENGCKLNIVTTESAPEIKIEYSCDDGAQYDSSSSKCIKNNVTVTCSDDELADGVGFYYNAGDTVDVTEVINIMNDKCIDDADKAKYETTGFEIFGVSNNDTYESIGFCASKEDCTMPELPDGYSSYDFYQSYPEGKPYNMTLKCDADSQSTSKEIRYDEYIYNYIKDEICETPDNKRFVGWAYEDGMKINTESKMPLNDITLYALYVDTYTLTFDANGGKFPENMFNNDNCTMSNDGTYTCVIANGENMPSLREYPTRSENLFAGFYDNEQNKYYDYDRTSVVTKYNSTSSIILYAQWQGVEFPAECKNCLLNGSIKIDNNIPTFEHIKCDKEHYVVPATNGLSEGVFKGTYDGEIVSMEPYCTPTTYSIEYFVPGGSGASAAVGNTKSYTYNLESETNILTDIDRSDLVFEGWTVACANGENTCNYKNETPSRNIILPAGTYGNLMLSAGAIYYAQDITCNLTNVQGETTVSIVNNIASCSASCADGFNNGVGGDTITVSGTTQELSGGCVINEYGITYKNTDGVSDIFIANIPETWAKTCSQNTETNLNATLIDILKQDGKKFIGWQIADDTDGKVYTKIPADKCNAPLTLKPAYIDIYTINLNPNIPADTTGTNGIEKIYFTGKYTVDNTDKQNAIYDNSDASNSITKITMPTATGYQLTQGYYINGCFDYTMDRVYITDASGNLTEEFGNCLLNSNVFSNIDNTELDWTAIYTSVYDYPKNCINLSYQQTSTKRKWFVTDTSNNRKELGEDDTIFTGKDCENTEEGYTFYGMYSEGDAQKIYWVDQYGKITDYARELNNEVPNRLYSNITNQYTARFAPAPGYAIPLTADTGTVSNLPYVKDNGAVTVTYTYDANNPTEVAMPLLESQAAGSSYYYFGWQENLGNNEYGPCQWPVSIPAGSTGNKTYSGCYVNIADACPSDSTTVGSATPSLDNIDAAGGIGFKCTFWCKSGYEFGCETGNEYGCTAGDASTGITIDSKYFIENSGATITCTPKTWNLSFDLNENTGQTVIGSVPTATTTVTYGEPVPEINGYTAPTSFGYTLSGWHYINNSDNPKLYNADGSVATTGAVWNVDVTDSTTATIRAYWEPKEYTIKFDKNCPSSTTCSLNGDETAQMKSEILTYNNAICIEPKVGYDAPGYKFVGWSLDGVDVLDVKEQCTADWSDEIVNDKNVNDSEITLYAIYEPETYTVTFNDNYSDTPATKTYYQKYATGWCGDKTCTTSVTEFDAPTRTGYTFNGYGIKNDDGTISDIKFINEDGKIVLSNNNTLTTSNITLYAKWTPNTYNITINGNGGTVSPNSVTATYDAQTNISGLVASREGYEFKGLYDATIDGTKYFAADGTAEFKWSDTGDKTLYAQWTAKQYSVSFSAGDGKLYDANGNELTNGTAGATMTYDAELPEIDFKASREGHRFDGWYYNNEQYYTADNKPVSDKLWKVDDAVTLTAKYTQYGASTIVFETNSGRLPDGYTAPTCVADTETWDLPIPTRTGYAFVGWLHNGQSVTQVEKGTCIEDTTLTYTAQWTANTFIISFDANGGAGGQSAPVTATYDSDMPTIDTTAPTRTGYTFAGWYNAQSGGTQYYNANGESVKTWDITDDTTLYAHWSANEYTITIDWDNDTPNETIYLTYGTGWNTNSITPRTKAGYTFAGIFDSNNAEIVAPDGTLTTNYTVFASNTTVTAKWTPIAFTITFDANGGTGNPYTQDFEYQVSENLESNKFTKEGYLFQGWAKNSASSSAEYENNANGSSIMTPTTDKNTITLYAVWKPITYTIAFDANGGIGNISSISATYDAPNNIATPNFTRTGYNLLGLAKTKDATVIDYGAKQFNNDWIYNLTTENGTTVTLYAVWEAKTYTAEYDCNGGSGTFNNGYTYESGIEYDKEYTLQSAFCTRDGYTFTGWEIGNDTYAASETITWTFDSFDSIEKVTAQWEPITYTLSYVCNIDENDNTVVKSQDVTFGEKVTVESPTCTKLGYKFVGWYDNRNGQGNPFESDLAWSTVGDKTLYAHWEKTSDTTISYKLGTGETLSSDDSVYYSCNVLNERTLPSVNKVGYTFNGWCVNSASCDTPITKFAVGECDYADDTTGTGGAIELYPQLEIKTYTVSWMCGESGGGAEFTETMEYNTTFTIPDSSRCNAPGYTFAGWKYNQDGTTYDAGNELTLTFANEPSSVEFLAQWNKTVFTITYNINGGTGTAPGNITCTYGEYDANCVAPSYVGMANRTKYFVGWAKDANATNADYTTGADLTKVTTNDAFTLYAVWQDCPSATTTNATAVNTDTIDNVCQYAVTCNDNYYNPTVNNADNESATAKCTPCPANSSRYGDATECTCNDGYSKKESSNTCTANVYVINYNPNGGSCTSENCMPTTYTYGKGATVGALEKTGYIFNGWCQGSMDTCATPNKVFTIGTTDLGEKTLSASWSPIEYTIAFDTNGATGAIGSMTLKYDETRTIPSASNLVKAGYSFAGWSGNDGNLYADEVLVSNLTTTNGAIITMTAKWNACTSDVDGACGCESGNHPENGICQSCYTECSSIENNIYTEGNIYTCGQSAGSAETSCYRYLDTSDVLNSLTVSGLKEYMNAIKSFDNNGSLTCIDGYYPNGTNCSECPAGSYCPAGTGKKACPNGTSSLAGASGEEECYTQVQKGGCVEFGANNECTKYVYCNPGWELNGDDCNECANKDGVLTYIEQCTVQTCMSGYHADGNSCAPDGIDCVDNIENAAIATKTWDEKSKEYGACIVSECVSEYHIENNTCVSNVRECETDYGSGTQTWKDNGEWGDCEETECNNGYELGIGGCVQCSNAANVSSWAQGCKIATCLNHGERFVIENNTCVEICPESGYTDSTGTRIWRNNKCITTCNAGYKAWK